MCAYIFNHYEMKKWVNQKHIIILENTISKELQSLQAFGFTWRSMQSFVFRIHRIEKSAKQTAQNNNIYVDYLRSFFVAY